MSYSKSKKDVSFCRRRALTRPRPRGELNCATHYGVDGEPGDGPYVQIWLAVKNGTILKASFTTPGCPSSTAAASVLCEIVVGRETSKVVELTGDDLLRVLGGLPEGKSEYAFMSVRALKSALSSGALVGGEGK